MAKITFSLEAPPLLALRLYCSNIGAQLLEVTKSEICISQVIPRHPTPISRCNFMLIRHYCRCKRHWRLSLVDRLVGRIASMLRAALAVHPAPECVASPSRLFASSVCRPQFSLPLLLLPSWHAKRLLPQHGTRYALPQTCMRLRKQILNVLAMIPHAPSFRSRARRLCPAMKPVTPDACTSWSVV